MQLNKIQIQKKECKKELDALTLRSETCRDLANTSMVTLKKEVGDLKTMISQKNKEINEACELNGFLSELSDLR